VADFFPGRGLGWRGGQRPKWRHILSPLEMVRRNINKLWLRLVVPTGLFPVKTGIYMPNNFKVLDRRPFGVYVKNSKNSLGIFADLTSNLGDRIVQKVQFSPGDSTQGFFMIKDSHMRIM
jgi:hypothetical protein